jgi:hypothetical protein
VGESRFVVLVLSEVPSSAWFFISERSLLALMHNNTHVSELFMKY